MSRVYVGNLDPRVSERDLEDEFRTFGVLRSVWVARRPPGYAFIEFDDRRDALDAIRSLDGKNGWRVEVSHNKGGGGRGGGRGGRGFGGGEDSKCYECGEPGHFARECRARIGSRGLGSGRHRSPSPRRRRSPSYGRRSYSPGIDLCAAAASRLLDVTAASHLLDVTAAIAVPLCRAVLLVIPLMPMGIKAASW